VAFVDGKGKGKATVGRTNDTTYTRLTIWVTQQRAVCFFFLFTHRICVAFKRELDELLNIARLSSPLL
jgi:hypothetical protein